MDVVEFIIDTPMGIMQSKEAEFLLDRCHVKAIFLVIFTLVVHLFSYYSIFVILCGSVWIKKY